MTTINQEREATMQTDEERASEGAQGQRTVESERTFPMTTKACERAMAEDDNDLAGALNVLVKAKKTRTRRLRELAPSSANPRDELRKLVREHAKRTQGAVALLAMGSDRKAHVDMPDRGLKKGDTIPCAYPRDVADGFKAQAKLASKSASDLEKPIMAQLRQCEVFRQFLKNVYGFGSGVCPAYLIAEIDIAHTSADGRQLRPSGLRRFCGFGVINGKLERPTRGVKLGYNSELRKRLWQAFQAMRKNAAKASNDAPYGLTNKYLDVWYNAKAGARAAGMPAGKADSKGRNKATDLFLLDLYTVWRAVEGLLVFPSYYEHHLGEGHRGWHLINQAHPGRLTGDDSKLLTVDAALSLVGDYGVHPLQSDRRWTMPDEVEEPEES